MRVTSRRTERVQHVTLGVTDVPDMHVNRSQRTYTPDTLTLIYANAGAGWRVDHVDVTGLRLSGYLRASDTWGANTINTAPTWVRTLAADNMPKDD